MHTGRASELSTVREHAIPLLVLQKSKSFPLLLRKDIHHLILIPAAPSHSLIQSEGERNQDTTDERQFYPSGQSDRQALPRNAALALPVQSDTSGGFHARLVQKHYECRFFTRSDWLWKS